MTKKILGFLLFISIFSIAFASGPYPGIASRSSEKGGRYITAEGNLHVFAVFIKWQDDTWGPDSVKWPLTGTPEWQQNFLDNTPGENLDDENLSQYFTEMSGGQFQLTGDVYPEVYIPSVPQTYFRDMSYGPAHANRFILEELDEFVDFSLYDNWSTDTTLVHRNVPDGKVDMVMLIHRLAASYVAPYCGYAGLDIDGGEYVTNDGVTIVGGTCGDFGSGLQLKYAIEGYKWTKYVTAHELGHYMLGSGHVGSLPYLSLMRNGLASGSSAGMCAVEREHLGWLHYTTLNPSGVYDITLRDYMTSENAVKIPSNEEWEYFVLENRQHYSIHDIPADKGLYVYHIRRFNYDVPETYLKCADGKWLFGHEFDEQGQVSVFKTEPYEGSHTKIDDELRFYDYAVNGPDTIFIYCQEGMYVEGNDAWGDDEDAFSLDFNPVFSPWSNPSNRFYQSDNTINFSVEVMEENLSTGDIKININFDNPEEHSPFRPMNLKLANEGYNTMLRWRMNTEPDFSHYAVYKKIGNDDYMPYDTTVTNTYIDNNRYLFPNNDYSSSVNISYKVLTVDTSGKQSTFSKSGETTMYYQGFLPGYNQISKKTLRNYPNPFNPSTTIEFYIEESAHCTISVYNIKGQLVKELYKGIINSGLQSIIWDGSNNKGDKSGSGIYFYKISSGGKEIFGKMLLLK